MTTLTATLALTWSVSANVSGLKRYDVDIHTDGGAWQAFQSNTQSTSASYSTSPGHRYEFRVTAIRKRNAGNVSTSAQRFASTPVRRSRGLRARP